MAPVQHTCEGCKLSANFQGNLKFRAYERKFPGIFSLNLFRFLWSLIPPTVLVYLLGGEARRRNLITFVEIELVLFFSLKQVFWRKKNVCLQGRFPSLPSVYIITQWSCSASGSLWEMLDSNRNIYIHCAKKQFWLGWQLYKLLSL